MVQVKSGCEERGLLMEAIWAGHTTFVEGILQRVREQCSEFRSRQALLPSPLERRSIHHSYGRPAALGLYSNPLGAIVGMCGT